MFQYQKKAFERKPVVSARDRFIWEAAVLASPDLSDADTRILMRLALHLNIGSGRLDVGIETLAKGAGQKPRKTTETITKAERLGFLNRMVGGGRKNTNSYQLLLQGETLHGDAGLGSETLHADVGNPAPPRKKPCPRGHPNRKNRKKNRNAEAPKAPWVSEEADYFRRGKEVLGPSAGGLLAKLRDHKGSIAEARAVVEIASQKDNPREYVGRVLTGPARRATRAGVIDTRATGII
jgi:hypothetical protein